MMEMGLEIIRLIKYGPLTGPYILPNQSVYGQLLLMVLWVALSLVIYKLVS